MFGVNIVLSEGSVKYVKAYNNSRKEISRKTPTVKQIHICVLKFFISTTISIVTLYPFYPEYRSVFLRHADSNSQRFLM